MSDFTDLPLFPLHAVTFPGQVLHLHVFEERYVELLEYCVTSNSDFSTALIKRGSEVGPPVKPYWVGVTCQILNINQGADGSFDVSCVGKRRIWIYSVSQERKYLTCTADLWPWVYKPEWVDPLAVDFQASLQEYRDVIDRLLPGGLMEMEWNQADTFNLDCATAASLIISNREKLSLLVAEDLFDLVNECQRILRRETTLLKRLAAVDAPGLRIHGLLSPN